MALLHPAGSGPQEIHQDVDVKMAAPNRYSFPSNPVANPKAVVKGGAKGSYYRFTVLTPRLVRYEWSEDGGFEDRVSTVAFWRNFEVPSFTLIETTKSVEIKTDFFHLTYDRKKFSPEGLSVKVGKDVWKYDGKSYGDLGGTTRTLDGADGRVGIAPGVLSRNKAYAVLDDSESMLFENGWIAIRRPGRKDGYVFAYDRDHKAAIKDFYRLSGKQPVLPRWTLGNWWSRYHAYSQEEYLDLMDRFKNHDVPLTVGVIDMDWHWVNIPPKYGSGWTGYSWNRELFPDPDGMMKELRSRGLKVALNDHPADGVRAFEDQYEEVANFLHHDTSKGAPIRFDCCDQRFLDAYFDVLKANLEKQGVDFWWIDWQQGERSRIPGVDPLWVLNHYHYLTSQRNVKITDKPITFSRYAGAGSHRYPIGFSGDTLITWASLQFQPEFTATASNIGYGWWSHDIGGHWGGTRSNELTARWVQFGCFSPILRLHSEKSQWNSKEPWKYEPETEEVMKKYLVLRHRLIPYLYTMNIRAAYDDEPLMQPMYWNHTDERAYTVPNQYYWGPDLIAAPITTPHSPTTLLAEVKTWLPEGKYVDLFHPGLVYDGDRYMYLHRPLAEIPVLAKEGTIVVLDGKTKFGNGVARPTDIEILLVVGADGHFELVEEPENGKDELSVQPPLSAFVRTPITWSQKQGKLTIGPRWNGDPKFFRNWTVKLVGHTASNVAAAVGGEFQVEVKREEHCTIIHLGDVHRWSGGGTFEISFGSDLQLDVVDVSARMHEMLYRCEMGYQLKEHVWWLTTQDGEPIERRLERLDSLGLGASLMNAIMEIWAADPRAPGSVTGSEVWADGEAPKEAEKVKDEDGYVLVSPMVE
ncbi:glycoside hydrolase [Echria macrotheca]|uniref:alpha-glucosidase n=1 Tax=Echria macrotheca TaxID=438768 RepID=A0AAJ0BL80_9PEZI|nr:glycoside hydrolase [Echria macrotheca]